MTSNGFKLEPRSTADGSFSLFSPEFGEAFHSSRGALTEAREKFVEPAGLERFAKGSSLRVLDVCVGTGCNTAALIEGCGSHDLTLEWWGLELDREPFAQALASPAFCGQWQPGTLARLQELCSSPGMLWGDARRTVQPLLEQRQGQFDLLLMDAFSPSRCPQLWSVEFLGALGSLLQPKGLLLTYCSAAAVRQALRLAGLELATIEAHCGLQQHQQDWSGGTAASPSPLPPSPRLRPLTPMEEEHLLTNAAEPYRDPGFSLDRKTILQRRQQAQAKAMQEGNVEGTSAWRRRWGLAGNHQ